MFLSSGDQVILGHPLYLHSHTTTDSVSIVFSFIKSKPSQLAFVNYQQTQRLSELSVHLCFFSIKSTHRSDHICAVISFIFRCLCPLSRTFRSFTHRDQRQQVNCTATDLSKQRTELSWCQARLHHLHHHDVGMNSVHVDVDNPSATFFYCYTIEHSEIDISNKCTVSAVIV